MKCLPVENNLINVEECENDFLDGTLRCDCGSEFFHILHNGVQRRTMFFQHRVSSNGKEFVLVAQCAACSKKFLLHWSEEKQPDVLPDDLTEFLLPRVLDNRWRVEVNYMWYTENSKQDGHWTDEYIDANIDIFNDAHPKKIRVFES